MSRGCLVSLRGGESKRNTYLVEELSKPGPLQQPSSWYSARCVLESFASGCVMKWRVSQDNQVFITGFKIWEGIDRCDYVTVLECSNGYYVISNWIKLTRPSIWTVIREKFFFRQRPDHKGWDARMYRLFKWRSFSSFILPHRISFTLHLNLLRLSGRRGCHRSDVTDCYEHTPVT